MKSISLPPLYTHPIGSLPRPSVVLDLLAQRQASKISAADFDRQMDDLVLFAIRLQEQAGMDVVSDGEWRRMHYLDEYLVRIGGFAMARPFQHHGVERMTWVCNGPIQAHEPVFARDAAFLAKHAQRATKFALPSPFLIAMRLWDANYSAEFYPTLEDLVNALADVLAIEARAVAEAGVTIIQIDDPALTYYCDPEFVKGQGHDSRIDMSKGLAERVPAAISAINRIAAGLPVEVHLHCCHFVFKRGSDVKGSYKPILAYFDQLRVDRINLEFAYRETGEAADLASIPANLQAGVGILDVRGESLQSVEDIVKIGKACLDHIAPERVAFNPDCGFAPDSGEPPSIDEAYTKLRNLCEAVRMLRSSRL
jgi:5-methyltetrahydropteroyltriglutamate--homocysteine methyltransferase